MASGKVAGINAAILWNLSGNVVPLLAAVFSIPLLIHDLGNERFGLLTIAWMLVGYFSLFDFGLGKALTKFTSEKLAKGREDEVPSLASHAMFGMIVLGVCAGLALAAISPWLTGGVLKLSSENYSDAKNTFWILALSVPVVVFCTSLIGLLEAHQRFLAINVIRIPLGISNFVGPLVALQFSNTLSAAVFTIFVFRVFALFFYWRSVNSIYGFWIIPRLSFKEIVPLLKFGGWASVSNLISPIMVYFDRFVIGSLLSLAVVAYYTTPYEIVSRVSIISVSMLGVFFPAMTAALSTKGEEVESLYRHAFMIICFSVAPLVAFVVAFAPILLDLWIGQEFSAHSSTVLRVLAVGVFFNSLARVPFGLMQAAGRADLTAKINLAEILPYVIILLWTLPLFGIVAAAYVWSARLFVDFLIMSYSAAKLVPGLKVFSRKAVSLVFFLVAYFIILVVVESAFLRGCLLVPLLGYAACHLWRSFMGHFKRGVV